MTDQARHLEPEYDEESTTSLEVLAGSRYFVRWKLIMVTLLAVGFSLFVGYLLLNYHVRYAVAAAVTAAACGTIAVQPQFGFYLYYLLAYSRPQDVFWGLTEIRLSLAVAGFALLAWVAHTSLTGRHWMRPRPQTGMLLLFGLVVVLSGMTHNGDWDRVTEFVKMILVALAFSAYVDREKWFSITMKVLTFGFGFLTLWGLYQHFAVGYHEITGPGNGRGPLNDRNAFAMFITMGIPFFYFYGIRSRNFLMKGFLLAMVPAAVYTVLLTSSRGGLLGTAAVVLTLGWTSRYRIPATIIAAVAMFAFYTFLAPSGIKNRAGTIVNYEEESSAQGRIDSWKAGIAMMSANPVLGVGPGQYVNRYRSFDSVRARQAHNTWVQAGAEFGVFGLILLLGMAVVTVRDLLRVRARLYPDDDMYSWCNMLLASMAGYFVCGFFLSMEGFELFYTIVGLGIAMTTMLRQRELLAEIDAADLVAAGSSEDVLAWSE